MTDDAAASPTNFAPYEELSDVAVSVAFTDTYPAVLARYADMQLSHRIYAVIGVMQFDSNRDCLRAAIDEFHASIDAIGVTASACPVIRRIFVFGADEPLPAVAGDVIGVPSDAMRDKLHFLLSTLIADVVVAVKRDALQYARVLYAERDLIRTPEAACTAASVAATESIGSIDGLARLKRRSRARKFKQIADIFCLFGACETAIAYYKAAASDMRESGDVFWYAATVESLFAVQARRDCVHLGYKPFKDFLMGLPSKYAELLALYARANSPFFVCNCTRYVAQYWLLIGSSSSNSSSSIENSSLQRCFEALAVLQSQLQRLTDAREQAFFLNFIKDVCLRRGMRRRAALASHLLLGRVGEARDRLLVDCLAPLSAARRCDWRVVRRGLLTAACDVVGSGSDAAAAFCRFRRLNELAESLGAAEQQQLIDELRVFAGTAAGGEWSEAAYDFVKSVAFLADDTSMPRSRPPEDPAKEANGGKGIDANDTSVFLYTPLRRKSMGRVEGVVKRFLVAGEPIAFRVALQNPFAVDIVLQDVALIGTNFEAQPIASLSLLRMSTATAVLHVTPMQAGKLLVAAVTFRFLFVTCRMAATQRPAANELRRFSSVAPEDVSFEFDVVCSLPLVEIRPRASSDCVEVCDGTPLVLDLVATNVGRDRALLSTVDFCYAATNEPVSYTLRDPLKAAYEAQESWSMQLTCTELRVAAFQLKLTLEYFSTDRKFVRYAKCLVSVTVRPSLRLRALSLLPFESGLGEQRLQQPLHCDAEGSDVLGASFCAAIPAEAAAHPEDFTLLCVDVENCFRRSTGVCVSTTSVAAATLHAAVQAGAVCRFVLPVRKMAAASTESRSNVAAAVSRHLLANLHVTYRQPGDSQPSGRLDLRPFKRLFDAVGGGHLLSQKAFCVRIVREESADSAQIVTRKDALFAANVAIDAPSTSRPIVVQLHLPAGGDVLFAKTDFKVMQFPARLVLRGVCRSVGMHSLNLRICAEDSLNMQQQEIIKLLCDE